MSSAMLQPETDRGLSVPFRATGAPDARLRNFIAALIAGGDGRMAVDPQSGLNKYLCPELPAPELTCLASCTASPISDQGFARANAAFLEVMRPASARQRAHRLTALSESVTARLLQYFGAAGLAQAILCPSGTDAILAAATLIAAERPHEPLTAILPAASETGTGVPMAAMCRVFDGPDTGRPLSGGVMTAVEIPLRSPGGSPRPDDAVNDAFATATAAAAGHVIVYLTHGTKTGLIAPVTPPPGTDVIVDACQGRIAPETVATYLSRGWPVIVTGSKFFGGPAFSGAVLFPAARLPAGAQLSPPIVSDDAACLGTALRWTAALATIDAFEPRAGEMAAFLSTSRATIERALKSNPALVPIAGVLPHASGWAGKPSTFTFAVRDPRDRARLLTAAELRPLYLRLAKLGILLGQPVDLGAFGGLRVAIGARDFLSGTVERGLDRGFAMLEHVVSPADWH
jgi:hypothetical protein